MLQGPARFRVSLAFVLAGALLYLATPGRLTLALGFPIALAGIAFRAAAAGVIRKNEILTRAGPYALTRNPLYFGSFLLAVGFAIMSGTLAAALLLILPFAFIYPAVIRNEESYLSNVFGSDFERFCSDVPCFLPRRLDYRLFDTFSLERYIANREYNAAFGFVAAVGVLVLKYFFATG